jgi:hypothetical protein
VVVSHTTAGFFFVFLLSFFSRLRYAAIMMLEPDHDPSKTQAPVLSYMRPRIIRTKRRRYLKFVSDLMSGILLGLVIPMAIFLTLAFSIRILRFGEPLTDEMTTGVGVITIFLSLIIAVAMLVRYRWYSFVASTAVSTGYLLLAFYW